MFCGQFPVQCSSDVGLEEEEEEEEDENNGKIMGVVPEQRFLEFRASDYPGGLVKAQVTEPHPCRVCLDSGVAQELAFLRHLWGCCYC